MDIKEIRESRNELALSIQSAIQPLLNEFCNKTDVIISRVDVGLDMNIIGKRIVTPVVEIHIDI